MRNSALLTTALSYSSVREIRGSEHSPEVIQFYASAGHPWAQRDEIAWCSAFMCHIVKEVGGVIPEEKTLTARSWLTLGQQQGYLKITNVGELMPGDIVVLWRNGRDSPYGHVGLYCSHDGYWMSLVGGNQSNRVRTKDYPRHRFLMGLRLQ